MYITHKLNLMKRYFDNKIRLSKYEYFFKTIRDKK